MKSGHTGILPPLNSNSGKGIALSLPLPLPLALFISLLLCLGVARANSNQLPTQENLQFTRITADDGISHTAVQRIMQDSQGFIWVGTQQGLNRYDGYEFEVFTFSPDDPNSLSNGWIYDIHEDAEGNIWVATDGGLDLFDARTKTFTHFRHDPENPASLPSDSVRSIYQARSGDLWIGTRSGLSRWDGGENFTHILSFSQEVRTEIRTAVRAITESRDGRLWVGTQTRGLLAVEPQSGDITRFEYRKGKANSTGDRHVRTLMVDNEDIIWIGMQSGGVARLDPATGEINRFSIDGSPEAVSSNRVSKIYQDRQGRIWIATQAGLNLWLPELKEFSRYQHDPANSYSLSDNMVFDVSQDEGNVIWVGTFNGISKWNSEIATFAHIDRQESRTNTLSNDKISSFAEADDSAIWVGTIGGGVNRWNRNSGQFDYFRHIPGEATSLADDLVMALLQDTQGRLWAGTMRRGLSRMTDEAGVFENFSHNPEDPSTLSSDAVSSLLQDSQGRIWVATYGGGLNKYVGEGRFQRYPGRSGEAYEFPSYLLADIEEGLDGDLWLANDGGGLIRFNPDSEQVLVMQHDENNRNSISGNHIICLLQTDTALWVGMRDTGLNRYVDGRWTHFSYADGLASNAIYGILEDAQKRIWISHSKGVSMYDPGLNRFTNYTTIHGLQGNDFNNGALLKTTDGNLLFGGTNGFNIFDPAEIHGNSHTPPVKLTRFTKFNREAELDVPAYEVDHIELNYDDYVVGFEFAALDFTEPAKNQYRYMLEGFDREWVDANNVRQVTYTNLAAGGYIFRVQGSNNDGVWNTDGLAISLDVAPPLWATWWALVLYIMLLLVLVYVAAHTYRAKLHRDEQRRYSEQLERLVAERTGALETEISGHKAAQEELSRSLQEKEVLLKEVHHRVKNNMQVISSLLNIQADTVMDQRFVHLLTESQQRIKSMALIHENLYRSDSLLEINFHEYIEMLANGLLRFYRFEDLSVSLELDVVDVFLDIDTAVPCGLIINELVSNSLKHAFKGRTGTGLISVSFVKTKEGDYCFSVADNGIGIPADMNIENSTSMGLEIVRILTEQLDGSWTYMSNSGTEFIVKFPGKNK